MDNIEQPPTLLPARIQPVVAFAVLVCLVGIAVWLVSAGGFSGGLIHHDYPPAGSVRFTLDINDAEEMELAQLPGLGRAMARRIIDHRQVHGPFLSIDSLRDVPGIGAVTLEHMRPYVEPMVPPKTIP